VKLQNSCVVPAGIAETWGYLMNVADSARCVPGVTEVSQEGEDSYRGTLKARVGPMSITLAGTVTVQEQESDSGRARFLVEASDRRVGGGVKTEMLMQLTATPSGDTELSLETDTTFMGRLGELGQPVIRRKAQATIEEFARNLSRELAMQSN
jgi:carbon monoxide dehydrogenase subunit G